MLAPPSSQTAFGFYVACFNWCCGQVCALGIANLRKAGEIGGCTEKWMEHLNRRQQEPRSRRAAADYRRDRDSGRFFLKQALPVNLLLRHLEVPCHRIFHHLESHRSSEILLADVLTPFLDVNLGPFCLYVLIAFHWSIFGGRAVAS